MHPAVPVTLMLACSLLTAEACNPTGNDPYKCHLKCEEDPSGPLCTAACELFKGMKNCPVSSDETRDLPYSYPCVCFVNPENDPVYDDTPIDLPPDAEIPSNPPQPVIKVPGKSIPSFFNDNIPIGLPPAARIPLNLTQLVLKEPGKSILSFVPRRLIPRK